MSVETPAQAESGAQQESGAQAAGGARTGVLWVPDWPIVAAVLEGDLPAHLPTALHDGRELTAVSAQARRLGVRRGMTRRTAQGLIPDLALGRDDPAQQVRAFEPVLQAVEEVVADVVLLRPGMAMLGVGGAAAYYGGEEQVAAEVVGAAVRAGVEAQVGVASGFLAATIAARESLIVPAAESVALLRSRPVEELLHAAVTSAARKEFAVLLETWRRLGLLRLGDVAGLRVADVAARFGRVGIDAYRLAQGLDIRLHAGRRSAADLSTGVDLDPPAGRLDTAAFAAREIAGELHGMLMGRGVACEYLRVTARTETGEELSRTWRLDGLLSASDLADRVRWQLAGWLDGRSGASPSAPLTRIDLTAEGNYPAGAAQRGLWGQASRSEEQAGRAAERVQGLLGPDGVVMAIPQGGRTPGERIRYVAWGDEPRPRRDLAAPWPGKLPDPLPTTVFEKPFPVELLGAEGPVRMTDRGGLTGAPEGVCIDRRHYPVEGWAGPWPIQGRWWEGEIPRVYLQVVSGAGAWLVAGGERGWVVEGVYD